MLAPLYSIQRLPTGTVSIMPRPRGGDWLSDEIKALRTSGVDILVSLLTADEIDEFDLAEEAVFCHQQGIIYHSLAIVDRSVPPFSDQTFSFLEQLRAALAEGKHIAFHCRQGIGRAALMAASLLVRIGLTPEQAFDLLSRASGYTVPETAEQRVWVEAFSSRVFKHRKAPVTTR